MLSIYLICKKIKKKVYSNKANNLFMKYLLLIHALFLSTLLSAQYNNSEISLSINKNGTAPHNSAILDLNSTNKGMLMPRLTTTQREAIVNPANGLMVFDLTIGSFWYYFNTIWNEVSIVGNNQDLPEWGNQKIISTETQKFSFDSEINCGSCVSVSGDYAIVGVSTGGFGQDAVYIYHKTINGWEEQTVLEFGGGFGYAVDISGDNIIVGTYYTPLDLFDTGSVRIFHRNGSEWIEQAHILSDLYTENYNYDNIGFSVAISNDYALIGNESNLDGSGTIDIYKRVNSNWVEQAPLIDRPSSFSISNDHIIVSGNPVLVFQRLGNNWIEQAQLTPNNLSEFSSFGTEVDIFENYAIISAKVNEQCAAYVFFRSGDSWIEQAKLIPGNNCDTLDSAYVKAVSISKNQAILSCNNSSNCNNTVTIFQREGSRWLEPG